MKIERLRTLVNRVIDNQLKAQTAQEYFGFNPSQITAELEDALKNEKKDLKEKEDSKDSERETEHAFYQLIAEKPFLLLNQSLMKVFSVKDKIAALLSKNGFLEQRQKDLIDKIDFDIMHLERDEDKLKTLKEYEEAHPYLLLQKKLTERLYKQNPRSPLIVSYLNAKAVVDNGVKRVELKKEADSVSERVELKKMADNVSEQVERKKVADNKIESNEPEGLTASSSPLSGNFEALARDARIESEKREAKNETEALEARIAALLNNQDQLLNLLQEQDQQETMMNAGREKAKELQNLWRIEEMMAVGREKAARLEANRLSEHGNEAETNSADNTGIEAVEGEIEDEQIEGQMSTFDGQDNRPEGAQVQRSSGSLRMQLA